MAILVSLSGLPGVGKTTLAKLLALLVPAIHLRVDSVEAALKRSILRIHPAEDTGYLAISSIAKDNLMLGFDVIADTVNPVEESRKLWTQTAAESSAHLLNVEVTCSDKSLHQKWVEARKSDIEGLSVPDWKAVATRTFEPWQANRIIIDTSTDSIDVCASIIAEEMGNLRSVNQ